MSNRGSAALLATLCLLVLTAPAGARSRARHHARHRAPAAPKPKRVPYSWEGAGTDLSPILVQPFQVTPAPGPPAPSGRAHRMNLEDGLEVRGTHWIARSDVRSRDLFILDITQSLEGGFDSVNMYDRGLLSWGIMQWTARSGSLAQALIFIKRRLWAGGRRGLWEKTFVANGLDVDAGGLRVYGQPVITPAQMRLAFRGTLKVGKFDPKLAGHWALALARAGRQPAVAALQVDYAAHVVEAVLNKRLSGLPYHAPGRAGLTPSDLSSGDPYTQALIFALWTNNPRHAFQYVQQAAQDARAASSSDDPSLWLPGRFSLALQTRCQESRFGNWPRRAALVQTRAQQLEAGPPGGLTPFEASYRAVLAARRVRRAAEIASRLRDKGGRKSSAGVTNVTPAPSEGRYTDAIRPGAHRSRQVHGGISLAGVDNKR